MGVSWFAIQLHKLSCSWIFGHDHSSQRADQKKLIEIFRIHFVVRVWIRFALAHHRGENRKRVNLVQ